MILLADAVWRRKSRIIIFIMFRPLESNWRSERRVRWFYRFVSMKVFPGLLHILSIWDMLNSNTLQLNFDKQSLSFSATNIKPTFSSMATRDHHCITAALHVWFGRLSHQMPFWQNYEKGLTWQLETMQCPFTYWSFLLVWC